MADQSDQVLIVPQSVINERSGEEYARVPQATSSTSNELARPQHRGDAESVEVVTVDLVGGTTRETARIQEVCSTSESDDEDEPVSEQEQVVREMPNLAAVALERLASRVQLQDELPEDDFRPVKRKCLPTAESDASGDNESEVSLCVSSD